MENIPFKVNISCPAYHSIVYLDSVILIDLNKANPHIQFSICSSTMEDIVDVESELTQRLSGLQKRLEKVAHPDLSHRGDLAKVHELIKANLQRSKVIQDQVNESKVRILLFD